MSTFPPARHERRPGTTTRADHGLDGEAAVERLGRLLAADDLTPLLDAMRQAASGGATAAAALADVVDSLAAHSDIEPEGSPARAAHEAREQQVTYVAIKSLAQVAREHPEAVGRAYAEARSLAAKDAVCEGASSAGRHHPALAALLEAHLDANASVAALSLAQYRHPEGRSCLLRALEREVDRCQRDERAPASPDLGSLHVEALLEALESFEPAVPKLWQARAEAVIARKRGRMGAYRSLLNAPSAPL